MNYAENVIKTVGVEAARRLVLDAYSASYRPGAMPMQVRILYEGQPPTSRMLADKRGPFYEVVRDAITVSDFGPAFRAIMARKHGRAGIRVVCGEDGVRLTFTAPDGKVTTGPLMSGEVSFREIESAADALIEGSIHA